jgi:hypothetical protein
MNTLPVSLGRGLGILLGIFALTLSYGRQCAAADPASGSVHRMVIQEGANRTVHYIASGNLSIGDRLAAAELERTENELTYLKNLQQLKHQYVKSEMSLEPYRRYVQGYLYGRQIHSAGYASTYANYAPNGVYGVPGTYGYNGFYSPYGYGYGYGGYGGLAYASRSAQSSSETRSLQFGMGNEGVLKNAIVGVSGIGRQASPDHIAAAIRDYQSAVARAAASPVLSRDLGLSKSTVSAPSTEPTFTKGAKATIWVGNEKYAGTVKDDSPSWVVLQTDKAEVTVRKSEITRAEVAPKP